MSNIEIMKKETDIDLKNNNINNNHLCIKSILENAIRSNSFFLTAQKIVSFDGEIIYHEILSRIITPNGNILYPETFLPVAKNEGLLASLDKSIIEKTLNFICNSPELDNNWCFSINLTPETLLEENFISYINNLLKTRKISPERIIFEIIESEIFDEDYISKIINELRIIGFKIAIDDFGAGHSNFARLKWLNIDILKIDGSFIKDILIDDFNRKAVYSFCEIAKFKKAKIVAEFVENKSTMVFLNSLGIDLFQGYYTGKPISLEKI